MSEAPKNSLQNAQPDYPGSLSSSSTQRSEVVKASSVSEQMDGMLQPLLLQDEMAKLRHEEIAANNATDGFIAGWRYGFMEARPGSLMIRLVMGAAVNCCVAWKVRHGFLVAGLSQEMYFRLALMKSE